MEGEVVSVGRACSGRAGANDVRGREAWVDVMGVGARRALHLRVLGSDLGVVRFGAAEGGGGVDDGAAHVPLRHVVVVVEELRVGGRALDGDGGEHAAVELLDDGRRGELLARQGRTVRVR